MSSVDRWLLVIALLVVPPTTALGETRAPHSPRITRQATECCKICTTGKACGDTCISRRNTCHKPPGCACDAR